jgi:hypothetical protein
MDGTARRALSRPTDCGGVSHALTRPGHNPGHLRDAFQEAVENQDHDRMRALAGRLWSCTDIMHSEYCSMLDMPYGSIYAQAEKRVEAPPPTPTRRQPSRRIRLSTN